MLNHKARVAPNNSIFPGQHHGTAEAPVGHSLAVEMRQSSGPDQVSDFGFLGTKRV